MLNFMDHFSKRFENYCSSIISDESDDSKLDLKFTLIFTDIWISRCLLQTGYFRLQIAAHMFSYLSMAWFILYLTLSSVQCCFFNWTWKIWNWKAFDQKLRWNCYTKLRFESWIKSRLDSFILYWQEEFEAKH